MKKFLFILFSIFCFQSIINSGPVLSIAKNAVEILDAILLNEKSKDDLWIESILKSDLYLINKLAADCPYLINQTMKFSKFWEDENITTALQYATKKGDTGIVAILLAHKANEKIKNKRGLNAQEPADTSDSKPMKRWISSPNTQRKYYQRETV